MANKSLKKTLSLVENPWRQLMLLVKRLVESEMLRTANQLKNQGDKDSYELQLCNAAGTAKQQEMWGGEYPVPKEVISSCWGESVYFALG